MKMLNKQTGNMYPFVTHTWNPIRGRCPHKCCYCYMKRFKVGELRLEEDELKTNLGVWRCIFVGSSTDMFAKEIPAEWIQRVLEWCSNFDNNYLFQTKNPGRFLEFNFPKDSILGTTIESNFNWRLSEAPPPYIRHWRMTQVQGKKMVSIEPILEFDHDVLVTWIKEIGPQFVSIGADSKGHGLHEPDSQKVGRLIGALEKFTLVKLKANITRIFEGGKHEG